MNYLDRIFCYDARNKMTGTIVSSENSSPSDGLSLYPIPDLYAQMGRVERHWAFTQWYGQCHSGLFSSVTGF